METSKNVRLVITHMELENFKSYAGVQRIGPFHKVRPCIAESPVGALPFRMPIFACTNSAGYFAFHQSFSSVVGPNGSGKSNVIDSMLFVFGKRAKQVG